MDNDIFKNKYALLDTNILSEMAKSKRAERFRPIFDFLKSNDVQPFLLDVTRFEFVAFSTNKKEFDFLNKWIRQFPIIITKDEDIDKAILLSSIYKHRDSNISSKQISYCDCLHAVQLIKYKEKAFIITADVYDYPLFLFDIEKTFVIDKDGKAVFVCLLTYNEKKWSTLNENFSKSG